MRGMVGTCQHRGEQHPDRCLAEFDFRMNSHEAHGGNDTKKLTCLTVGGV